MFFFCHKNRTQGYLFILPELIEIIFFIAALSACSMSVLKSRSDFRAKIKIDKSHIKIQAKLQHKSHLD